MKNIFPELFKVQPGIYYLGYPWWKFWTWHLKAGWVSIDNSDVTLGYKSFLWTAGKTTHNPITQGPAMAVNLTEKGEMNLYMKTALSMHIRWDGHYRNKEEDYLEGLSFINWVYYRLIDTGVIDRGI